MKRVLGFVAVALVSMQSFVAPAAEPAESPELSRSQLSAMGLPGLKVVTDEHGEKVRGMGNTVFGSGFALSFFLGIGFSHNSYHSPGHSFSVGTNGVFAGGSSGGRGL